MVITRTSRRAPARSFALVDCIVATVLLAVSLTVTIGLTGRALSSQSTGEHLSTAAMLADEQLHLVLARGPDDYARRFAVQGACEAPFTDYQYKLSFTGGGSVGEPYQVTCTISWRTSGSTGQERAISIDTLVAARNSAGSTEPDPIRAPRSSITRTP